MERGTVVEREGEREGELVCGRGEGEGQGCNQAVRLPVTFPCNCLFTCSQSPLSGFRPSVTIRFRSVSHDIAQRESDSAARVTPKNDPTLLPPHFRTLSDQSHPTLSEGHGKLTQLLER